MARTGRFIRSESKALMLHIQQLKKSIKTLERPNNHDPFWFLLGRTSVVGGASSVATGFIWVHRYEKDLEAEMEKKKAVEEDIRRHQDVTIKIRVRKENKRLFEEQRNVIQAFEGENKTLNSGAWWKF